MTADARYEELSAAAAATPRLLCTDGPRYLADPPLHPADVAELEAGCALCPIHRHCSAYAAAARPEGGFWAGRYWSKDRRNPALTPHNQ